MPTQTYFAYDPNGFLLGAYAFSPEKASNDLGPAEHNAIQPNSTPIPYAPIEPRFARFFQGAWIEDHARDDAVAKEVLRAAVFLATEKLVDATAVAWGYDDIEEAVSYAEEPAIPQYQAEGRALRAWRSKVWAIFEGNADVLTSVDGFLAQLPTAPARPT